MHALLRFCLVLVGMVALPVIVAFGQDEPVFSGPQAGEPLPGLKSRLILNDAESSEVDLAASSDDVPHRVVILVHQLTRPSIAYTRVLGNYVAQHREKGIQAAVVFLGDDATETTERVTRARHALPQNVDVGLSVDGAEGPGSYGLNRNVTLTVLVASQGKVTFNQALIDPSLPVELPKALRAVHDLIGGEPAEVETLIERQQAMTQRGAANNRQEEERPEGFDEVEPLLRRLIRKETADNDVDKLAKQIDEILEKHSGAKRRVKDIANRVHAIYGTARAQHHLRRWAEVEQPKEEP